MGKALIAVVALVVVLIAGWAGNKAEARHRTLLRVAAMTGGDPHRGQWSISHKPCGQCHVIPGVTGAKGSVGPPLTKFAGRAYIAGRAANSPDALVRFLEDPHTIDPESAMPNMGIGEAEARDIAAYLYTLS